MREVIFSKENNKRWEETNSILNNNNQTDPDTLARLFIQLTDDLAYSQTYFPGSKTTNYLNQLTLLAHQKLYVNKKENLNRLSRFFKYDYPFLIHKHYKKLFYAFAIFLVSCLIGAFSTANDDTFVRLIMGDEYVNTTIENIKSNKPLGIYDSMGATAMFFYITLNNIKVALMCFAFGIFFSVGTGYMLFKNGIMLGAFQYFFYQENLLTESLMGIWMHGTIEIFSIVVAGAAGLVVGNSFLFPGTYTRGHSLMKGAGDGIRIVFGLIPFFIIAGFIESYLTRHSETQWLSLSVIFISIILIGYYFFIYPILLNRKICKKNLT